MIARQDNAVHGDARAGAVQELNDDELSIVDVWRAVVGGKWIIVLVTLAGVTLAMTVALVSTPIYRAEILLSVREDAAPSAGLARQLGGLASLGGLRLGTQGAQRAEAIAMLSSETLTESFIRENKLLPILFDESWDSQNNAWSVDDQQQIPTIRRGVRFFDENVRSVREDESTGLITLAIEWKDPKLAAEWANSLVRMLNEEMRQRAISEATQSVAYLERELQRNSVVEVRQSIYDLIQQQIETIMLANVRRDFAFQVLDPAVVPEPNEIVRPRPVLLVAIGIILGLMISGFAIFVRAVLRSVSASSAATREEASK